MDTSVPFSQDLAAAIRGIPPCIDARAAAELLEKTADWGGQHSGGWRGLIDPQVDVAPLERAIQAARDLATWFREQLPFLFWRPAPTYCTGAPEKDRLISAVTNVYAEASALAGQTSTIDQARMDLAHDLKENAKEALDWGGVGIGVLVLVLVLVYVLPLFRRG